MVLASPGPLLTPPPSSSPRKTPFRSYSATTPPRYVNPTPPSPGGRGSSRQGRGMGGQNGPQADTKPRTLCSSIGFGGSSRNRQNLSHPFTKCFQKSRSTRLTVVHLRGRKFSFCTPSQVHLSRTSSSLVASRRPSISRMTPWLLLLTKMTPRGLWLAYPLRCKGY
jgi:hypothetical protein